MIKECAPASRHARAGLSSFAPTIPQSNFGFCSLPQALQNFFS
jgi:hypothetical protein